MGKLSGNPVTPLHAVPNNSFSACSSGPSSSLLSRARNQGPDLIFRISYGSSFSICQRLLLAANRFVGKHSLYQRTLTVWGRITVRLVSGLTRLDSTASQHANYNIFSSLVKSNDLSFPACTQNSLSINSLCFYAYILIIKQYSRFCAHYINKYCPFYILLFRLLLDTFQQQMFSLKKYV